MAAQSHSLWCSRNRCPHGSDPSSNRQTQLTQARRDVSALYELQDRVLPGGHDLFCASLEVHLLQPLTHLRHWLVINKDLILHSVRTATAQAKSKTKPIRTFFSSLGRRPPPPHRLPKASTPKPSLLPLRITHFFPVLSTKPRRSLSHAPASSKPPSASFSRPLQRYLFDFFPNHPG